MTTRTLLTHEHVHNTNHPLSATATVGGSAPDAVMVSFGIRTIEFSTEGGFLLNGEPTILKGGCVHHDNGALGSATIDRAEERRVQVHF